MSLRRLLFAPLRMGRLPEEDPLSRSYLVVTHPVGPTPSLRWHGVEYIQTRPSNTLITYASDSNELSWTLEDCCCLWQLIIWPIDQNCSTHHRAPCPLLLRDHRSLRVWVACVNVCVCVRKTRCLMEAEVSGWCENVRLYYENPSTSAFC